MKLDRAARDALREKLQTDNAIMFAEMAERRERLGDDAFEPTTRRRDNITSTPNGGMTDAQVMALLRSYVAEQLDEAADDIGSECGMMEKRIIERQDAELSAIRSEVSALRDELADLRETVNALTDDLAAMRDDVDSIERSGSGRKIVAAFRSGGRHAD